MQSNSLMQNLFSRFHYAIAAYLICRWSSFNYDLVNTYKLYDFICLIVWFVFVCCHRATGEGGMNREEAPGKSPEDMYIQQKVRVLLMLKKMGSNVGRLSGQPRPLYRFWAGLNSGPSTSNAKLSPEYSSFFSFFLANSLNCFWIPFLHKTSEDVLLLVIGKLTCMDVTGWVERPGDVKWFFVKMHCSWWMHTSCEGRLEVKHYLQIQFHGNLRILWV